MNRDAAPSPSPLALLIDRQAIVRGTAPYLRSARDARTVSFSDLAIHTAQWRDRFRSSGVNAGSRVGLGLRDPLTFATAFLGGIAEDLWMVPFDPSTETANPEGFHRRSRQVGMSLYVCDEGSPAGVTIRRIGGAREFRGESPVDEASESGGVVMASSGTSGAPKIMRLSTAQLLGTAALVASHHELTPADKGFNPLPLFHINAEVVGLLATLFAGSSLILDERFHRTDFWAIVDSHEATWINAVPAIIARLIPLREGESVARTLRFVRSASAPLPTSLLTSFEAATGLPIIESYGMTEAASQICVNPLDGSRRVGSVGRPVGVRLRVATDDGALAAANEVGQVEITGPTVITHYDGAGYEDRFSDDGWLRTNDLGYLDEEGYVFLIGRSDDVINRGGEKIFPSEIEEVLLRSPDVEVAAVIGVPDDVFGQVPVAYVQLRGVDASTAVESIRPTVKELREALIRAFARTRRPREINVIERLPAHATGKIQKSVLRTGQLETLLSEPVG